MKTKHCKWCDKGFETELSYQIYCSAECREQATKEKIAERYIANRRKKWQAKPRYCTHCNIKLSVYNDDPICENCNVDPKGIKLALREIRRMSKDG